MRLITSIQKKNVELDSRVTKEVLTVHDSTNIVISDKGFIQDFEVEDLSMEEQVPPMSSSEEKNVTKASFKDISNEPKVSNK